MLQQTIGEPSGAGAQVDASGAGDRETEMVESVFQFVTTSGNVAIAGKQLDRIALADPVARLLGGVSVDPDLSGHDGALGLRAGFAETAVYQCLIDAGLQRWTDPATVSVRRQSPIAPLAEL